jgi:hypothetical protein
MQVEIRCFNGPQLGGRIGLAHGSEASLGLTGRQPLQQLNDDGFGPAVGPAG